MNNSNKFEVILLGDDNKTNLIKKLSKDLNPKIEDYLSSSFYHIDITIWNNSILRIKINDHNDNGWKKGQCYKNVSAAYIVFDASKGIKAAQDDIQYYVQDINRFSNNIKITLISSPSEDCDMEIIKDYASTNGFDILDSKLSQNSNEEKNLITFREVFFRSVETLLTDEIFDPKCIINNDIDNDNNESNNNNNNNSSKRNSKNINDILTIIPTVNNFSQSRYEENFHKIFSSPKLYSLIFQYVASIHEELGLKGVKFNSTSISWLVSNKQYRLLKYRILYDNRFIFSFRTLLDLFKLNKNLDLCKTIVNKYQETLKHSEKSVTENASSLNGNLEIIRYLYGQDFKFTIHCLYNSIVCGDLEIIKFLMKHCKLFSEKQHIEVQEMTKAVELSKQYKRPEIKSYISKHCSTKTKSISLLFSNLKKKISGNDKNSKSIDLNASDDSI